MASSLRQLICLSLLVVATILPASAFGKRASNGVTFRQNSKVMYDKIMDGVPSIFRGRTRARWEKAIAETCEGFVTEEHVYEIAVRTTPKLFLKEALAIIEDHKTT